MKTKLEAFAHTFLMVMLSIAVYNVFVKQYTPSSVQGWIGF